MEPHAGNVLEAQVADDNPDRPSRRGRRWLLGLLVVVLVAGAAVGGVVLGRTTAPGPAVVVAPGPVVEASPEAEPIPVGLPASPSTDASDASATVPDLLVAADSVGAPAVVLTAGDGLADAPTTASGYRIVNEGISGGQVAAVLAAAFGAAGTPTQASGTWTVGSPSGPRLVVQDDPLVSWEFVDDTPTATPATGPTLDAGPAIELATTVLGSIGVDTASVDWQVDRYADLTQVTAWQTVAGARTSLAWQIGFAPDGAIMRAYGFSAGLHEVPGYPVVGARTAVVRSGQAGWNALVPRLISTGVTEPQDAASPSAVPTTSPGPAVGLLSPTPEPSSTQPEDTFGSFVPSPSPSTATPVEPSLLPSLLPSASPLVPDPDPSPRPSVSVPVTAVTADSAELGVAQYWQADGSLLILPAYVVTGADGSRWSVLAVDSSYVAFVETPPSSAAS